MCKSKCSQCKPDYSDCLAIHLLYITCWWIQPYAGILWLVRVNKPSFVAILRWVYILIWTYRRSLIWDSTPRHPGSIAVGAGDSWRWELNFDNSAAVPYSLVHYVHRTSIIKEVYLCIFRGEGLLVSQGTVVFPCLASWKRAIPGPEYRIIQELARLYPIRWRIHDACMERLFPTENYQPSPSVRGQPTKSRRSKLMSFDCQSGMNHVRLINKTSSGHELHGRLNDMDFPPCRKQVWEQANATWPSPKLLMWKRTRHTWDHCQS